jgi:hypothetical protein
VAATSACERTGVTRKIDIAQGLSCLPAAAFAKAGAEVEWIGILLLLMLFASVLRTKKRCHRNLRRLSLIVNRAYTIPSEASVGSSIADVM